MKVQPLGKRVLVKEIEAPKETPGGIALPDTAEDEGQSIGTVVAVGSMVDRLDVGITIGHVVLFGKYAGDFCVVDGEEFRLLKVKQILAKVTED